MTAPVGIRSGDSFSIQQKRVDQEDATPKEVIAAPQIANPRNEPGFCLSEYATLEQAYFDTYLKTQHAFDPYSAYLQRRAAYQELLNFVNEHPKYKACLPKAPFDTTERCNPS